MVSDSQVEETPAVPDWLVRQALLVLFPLTKYRSVELDQLTDQQRGQVRAVAELMQKYEAERAELQDFRTMVVDLDRNEHGRHEGDADTYDPSGVSQGNPLLHTGDVLGYSLGGSWRYVMPERGQRHRADNWKVDNRG